MAKVEQSTTETDRRFIRVLIWDIPTRLVHWILVALFAFSWWTADHDQLEWHRYSGYGILALLLFRLYWGVRGSTTARFATFIKGPVAFLSYARRLHIRDGQVTAGHNPMGGWSVASLLLLLIVQVGLGLFAVDTDGLESGPLSSYVSFETGRWAAHWHGRIFNLLLVFVILHLAAVLFYLLYKRENLVAAMLGGYKTLPAPKPALQYGTLIHAALAFIGAALIAFVVSRGLRL